MGHLSGGLFGKLLCLFYHFIPLLLINGRQEIIDYVILPVVDHPVSLYLLGFQVYALNTHSSVASEVSESYFLEFLCEEFFVFAPISH